MNSCLCPMSYTAHKKTIWKAIINLLVSKILRCLAVAIAVIKLCLSPQCVKTRIWCVRKELTADVPCNCLEHCYEYCLVVVHSAGTGCTWHSLIYYCWGWGQLRAKFVITCRYSVLLGSVVLLGYSLSYLCVLVTVVPMPFTRGLHGLVTLLINCWYSLLLFVTRCALPIM